ncbi:response regulator [Streptomyces sp. NPDC050560]|uniref:response regulator n=1 Tax=Streptomyces sp. NPDC050560 TaxID=3365630 RepID=UPI0037928E25
MIRQLIRVNLELEGFEVVTAADGAECLDMVHQVRPDLVTLDVVMPRLDGLRTAARLRADPRTSALPLVIVSACSPHQSEVRVDAFLAKPFEPAELVRTVRQLLERRRYEEAEERERDARGGDAPGAEGSGLGGRRDGPRTGRDLEEGAGRGFGG